MLNTRYSILGRNVPLGTKCSNGSKPIPARHHARLAAASRGKLLCISLITARTSPPVFHESNVRSAKFALESKAESQTHTFESTNILRLRYSCNRAIRESIVRFSSFVGPEKHCQNLIHSEKDSGLSMEHVMTHCYA